MIRLPGPATVLMTGVLLLSACRGESDTGASATSTVTAAPGSSSTAEAAGSGDGASPTGDLGDCPDGYDDGDLLAGSHESFASAGQERSFHLLLPEEASTEPAPLFVSLTGTVQEEVDFMVQSGLDRLPGDGWVVVAPVRNQNGIIWAPWDAMRTPDMTQANPDETLILDLVECISAHHRIDPDRVFIGGVSIGGTFTTYMLRRHSDTFAGGIVSSGNYVLTEPPSPQPLDAMTVIVTWGGDSDRWTGCPDGRMGEQYAGVAGCVSVDFVRDTQDAIAFYASEPEVAVMACSAPVGHIWISDGTDYWADVLAARPKGTTAPLDIGSPPESLSCEVHAR